MAPLQAGLPPKGSPKNIFPKNVYKGIPIFVGIY